MKNTKLEAKHIRLIATVASIAVFLYVFLVVYDDYSKKTEDTKKQYDMVQRDISTRQQALDDEPRIVEEVNKINDKMNQVFEKYPSEMSIPNTLMVLQEIQNENKDVTFSSIAFNEISSCDSTDISRKDRLNFTDTDQEGTDTNSDSTEETATSTDPNAEMDAYIHTMRISMSISYQAKYDDLKKLLRFIQEYPQRVVVDNIQMGYDTTSGLINGSITLSMYAMIGTGIPFEEPQIDGIEIGKVSIFDTIGTKDEKKEKKAETQQKN